MKSTCKWNDPEQQNMLWKTKKFDYQFNTIVSVKFSMIRYLIQKIFQNQKISILDIGGGDGQLFFECISLNISQYHYIDISEEASNKFKSNLKIIPNNVYISQCNINKTNFDKKVEVICIAGFAANLYDEKIIQKLFNENLTSNGALIIEHTNFMFNWTILESILPKPFYKVNFDLFQEELTKETYIPHRSIGVYIK
jgi:16S rRNA G966 N2-methylase RsmD